MTSQPRYPAAEWVPWRARGPRGEATFWAGENVPAAAVLHIMAGYAHTAREWALAGHVGVSWHFTVARDGGVMQHLELSDAGWHAGLRDDAIPAPWPSWRGHGQNVNRYTVGIEHEGFPGEPLTAAQTAASIALCRWLAETLGFAFNRAHFPAHADIDPTNRPNDFNMPALREQHYAALLAATPEEDEMTPQEVRTIAAEAAQTAINDAFETALPAIFRRLMHAYWLPESEDGYADAQGKPIPPDGDVVRAVRG